jgi:hypothetical protein
MPSSRRMALAAALNSTEPHEIEALNILSTLKKIKKR